MATKTFEELKQLAIQIRDEKTNKQNTATRIGTQMLEHLDKLEQDYYDKTATDEELKERDEKLENKTAGVNYVTCDTVAGIADKVVTVTGLTALTTGIRLLVKMTNNNTASNATLNINSLGAKPLYYNNERVSGDNAWKAGEIVDIYYDGTNFYSGNFQGGSGEGGNLILEWNTDVATTRKQVKQSKRKSLLQINYKNADGDLVNEQYVGTTFTDTEWIKGENWKNVSYSYDVAFNLIKEELLSENISEWENGLLENNGNITNGYNGHTSNFIEVIGGIDVIAHSGKNNYDPNRPTVLGYREDKSVYGKILSGITDNNKINDLTYFEYGYIPKEVKYVRISSNGDAGTFIFKKIGIGNIIEKSIRESQESSNLWNPYLKGMNSNGSQYIFGGGGTDYIPVYEGMTIYCSSNGFGNIGGICVYDRDKSFIENLPLFYGQSNYYQLLYTFTKEDIDKGVAYLKSSFLPSAWSVGGQNALRVENFFYIFDKFGVVNPMPNSLLTQLFLSGTIGRNNFVRNVEPHCKNYSLDKYATTTIEGNTITTSKSGDLFKISYKSTSSQSSGTMASDTPYRIIPKGFTRAFLVKIKLLELESDDLSASLGYYNNSAICASELTVGSEVVVPIMDNISGLISANLYFKPITVSGQSKWKIIDVCTFIIKTDFVTRNIFITSSSQLEYDLSFLAKNKDSLYDRFNSYLADISFADYAKEAETCLNLQPDSEHSNKTYVSFGTSITAGTNGGYAPYIAKKFNMNLLNLGVSGSVPHGTNGSLRDERLAMIPEDTMLVTICYGANGWKHDDDIDSRDTENSIGAFNHAIDYIIEHFPKATICLGVDYSGRDSTQNTDIMAIAKNRHVSYAPTYMVDEPGGERTANNVQSYDGVHLTLLGNYRMAACFIEEIKKSIFIGGI